MPGVDATLIAEMLDRHGPALAFYARQWTSTADDCVQEALVELARQPATPDNPAAWLYRVVRNRALNAARARSAEVEWVPADLTTWEPAGTFDLVTTFYAHASIPQLELYDRIARWVAPSGILLVVGHLHDGHHPDEASVTSADIVARLGSGWRIDRAEDRVREVAEHATRLADAVVRATRV